MRTDTAQPVRLSDYRAPDYLIDAVDLDIRLHLSATHIRARLSLAPIPWGVPARRSCWMAMASPQQPSFLMAKP